MKNKLKKRLVSATAILAVLVLVFACSNINLIKREIETKTATIQNSDNSAKNEIAVIKDSTGINLRITGVSESGVDSIEIYQGTTKIKDFMYGDDEKVHEENFRLSIPFGETHQITMMVNGEAAAQKDVQNMRYISTAQDMVAFRDAVNGGNSFAGKYVEILENIDMSEVCSSEKGSFTPIGQTGTYFAGNFNGNFHTISKLYISQAKSSGANYVGMFNILPSTSVVENIILENVNVNSLGNSNINVYIGGIVAELKGRLRNCGVQSGTITATNTASNAYARIFPGGVMGDASSSTALIENCYNRATINATINGTYSGGYGCYAGGVGGFVSSGATLDNCYNTGNITIVASGNRTSSSGFIGGVVGNMYTPGANGYIRNSYSSGNVSSSGYTATHIAGIVGSNGQSDGGGGTITNSWCLDNNTYSYKINSSRSYSTANRVSAATLKGYANVLGANNWVTDIYGINAEYPILRWQIPTIEFNEKQVYTNVGNQIQLNLNTSKYTAANPIGTITYTSDNTSVATVNNTGKITATGEGYTTVYATESTYGLKAMMIINVAKSGAVAFSQSQSGGLDTTAKYTVVLKEDGTVWRNRR